MYDELVKALRFIAKQQCRVEGEQTTICATAADAIEQLSNAGSAYGRGWTLGYDTGREESKLRWIPVTERLPMRGEKAICFGKNGYMIGTYGEFGWMFPCYFGNVTHWMPLPKQPEDGAE